MVANTETGLAVRNENHDALSASVFDRLDPMDFIDKIGKVYAMTGAGGCKTENDGKLMALACLHRRQDVFEIAEEYHLIDGKLSIKADSALDRFQKSGGKTRWLKNGDDRKEAQLELTGPDGITITTRFTIEMAEMADLVKPKSNWVKWTPAMLRSRCITEGIRMQWPGILKGHYSTDEIQDVVDTTAVVRSSVKKSDEPKLSASTATASTAKPAAIVAPATETIVDVVAEVVPPAAVTTSTVTTVAETTQMVESPPFEVGDADESTIPSGADATFQAAVLEIELLLPDLEWTQDTIVPHYNKKFGTSHTELGQFDDSQLDFILTRVREVHAKWKAGLLASK